MGDQHGIAQRPGKTAPARPFDALLQRAAPLTTVIWLLLFILPLANLARSQPPPPHLLATLAVVLGLVTLYCWLTLHERYCQVKSGSSSCRGTRAC